MTKTRSQMKGRSLLSEIPQFPERPITKKKNKHHQTKPTTTTKKKNKHLSYATMIRSTLTTFSSTSTTTSKPISSNAIARYLTQNFGVVAVNKTHLNKVLQQGVEKGALKKVKRSFLLTRKSTNFGVSATEKKRLATTPPKTTSQPPTKQRKVSKQHQQQQQKKKTPTSTSTSTSTTTRTSPSTPSPTPSPTPTPSIRSSPPPSSRPLSQHHEGKYELKIENFLQKQTTASQHPHLLTPSFSLSGHTWSFLIFPLGNHQTSCLSIYLVPEGAPTRKEVEMKLYFKGLEGVFAPKTAKVVFEVGEGGRGVEPKDWGFEKFVEMEKLKEGGAFLNEEGGFTIVVEVKVKE